MLDRSIHDHIDVDFAWDLVERFSTAPRERPEDACRGAEIIAERVRAVAIPVTMHVLESARARERRDRRKALAREAAGLLGKRAAGPERTAC